MKLVSACLAGINCRHDAKNSANEKAVALVKEGKAIPVCPELLAGFSIPRETMELCNGMVLTMSGIDVTKQVLAGAEKILRIAKLVGAKEAILKTKSPSCGFGKVFDGSFTGKLIKGKGITADLIEKNGIKVLTEEKI